MTAAFFACIRACVSVSSPEPLGRTRRRRRRECVCVYKDDQKKKKKKKGCPPDAPTHATMAVFPHPLSPNTATLMIPVPPASKTLSWWYSRASTAVPSSPGAAPPTIFLARAVHRPSLAAVSARLGRLRAGGGGGGGGAVVWWRCGSGLAAAAAEGPKTNGRERWGGLEARGLGWVEKGDGTGGPGVVGCGCGDARAKGKRWR